MNKKQLKTDFFLITLLIIITGFYFIIKHATTYLAQKLSLYQGIPFVNLELISLLGIYFFFIALGSFLILRRDFKWKLKIPKISSIFLFIFLFISYIYTSHLVPKQIIDKYLTGILIINTLTIFTLIFMFSYWLLNIKKPIFMKLYLISILTIVLSLIAYYDSFLVRITMFGSLLLLNLFTNASLNFVDYNSASFSSGDFSVSIGTKCSGIESAVIFASLFILIYLLEHNSIKNKKKFFLWGIAGLFASLILNIIRVSALMLIGRSNPVFAIDVFHTYSGMFLFLAFMLPYIYLLYKYNIKKQASRR